MLSETEKICPYCKETIKKEAIKCKYCHSMLTEESPSHHGICPYCKEEIKPDAIKCKHCGSMLTKKSCTDCPDFFGNASVTRRSFNG